jgi:hypothetical protein
VHTVRVHDQAKQVAHSGTPPSALAIPRDGQPAAQNPGQEKNHEIPGRVQVPQADPPMIGLHNTNQEQSREKWN